MSDRDFGIDYYQKIGEAAMAQAKPEPLERIRELVNSIPSYYEEHPESEVIYGAPKPVQNILKGFSPIQMLKSVTNSVIDLMQYGAGERQMKPEEVVLSGMDTLVPMSVAGRFAYPVGSLGVFGSRLSKGSKIYQNLENDMADFYAAGHQLHRTDPKITLQKTGLSKDFNGNWVIEIDDSKAKLNPFEVGLVDRITDGSAALPELLNHPDLYEAFPYLEKITVKAGDDPSLWGQFAAETNQISVSPDLSQSDILSVLLHEAQHAVNSHEAGLGVKRSLGETVGSELHSAVDKLYDIYDRAVEKDLLSPEEALKMNEVLRELGNADWEKFTGEPFYHVNPGEVEARNVQTRQHLGSTARRIITPEETEDVPRSQQLDLDPIRDLHAEAKAKGVLSTRPPAAPFYSVVENAIESSDLQSAPSSQWGGIIRNTPGVKQEEIEWLGLDEFLASGKVLSKDEVADYVRNNKVQVTEVVKGEPIESVSKIAWTRRDDGVLVDQYNQFFIKRDEATGQWLLQDLINNKETLFPNREIAQQQAQEITNNVMVDQAVLPDNTAQYESYVLPGGENYREMLFTLPQRAVKSADTTGWKAVNAGPEFIWDVVDAQGNPRGSAYGKTPEEAIKVVGEAYGEQASDQFRTGHWQEPNVLAHTRMNEREIAGEPTLFIEEIQSDWHQTGRRFGYQDKPEWKVTDLIEVDAPEGAAKADTKFWFKSPDGEIKPAWGANADDAKEAVLPSFNITRGAKAGTVPDAPFKKTWPDLVLKRMVREAVDRGKTQIAWPEGATIAERFDISKRVDAIQVFKNQDETYTLVGEIKPDYNIPTQTINIADHIAAGQIADYVGKELGNKIVNETIANYRRFEGTDLKVGGEGMKGFYDDMLPRIAEKLFKRFGAKVVTEEIDVPGYLKLVGGEPGSYIFEATEGEFKGSRYNGFAQDPKKAEHDLLIFLETQAGHDYRLLKTGEKHKVHVLKIPPAMAEVARNEGFSLFAGGVPPVFGDDDEQR